MDRYLLDVNCLLAFLDPLHIHHHAAHSWYKSKPPIGLLICSHVENGVMRIASQARYPNCMGSAATIREILCDFIERKKVDRCSRDTSLLDREILINPVLLTHSSVADLYLLAVASANDAKLATFDKRIQPGAIKGGKSALELIPILLD